MTIDINPCATCVHKENRPNGDPCWKCIDFQNDEIVVSAKFYKKQTITNADRIRTMTNEELANMWCVYIDCGECPNRIECSMTYQDCLRFALKWLEQECET